MSRTIVYENADTQLHYRDLVRDKTRKEIRKQAGPLRQAARRKTAKKEKPDAETKDATRSDDYLSKIAKYVPAEMITLATLGFAAFSWTGGTLWVVVSIGAALNVVYLLSVALGQADKVPPPPFYFYVLSIAAFLLWTMATIDPVQKAAGIRGEDVETKKTFVLALAAFIVPALDTVAARVDISVRKNNDEPE